ncbi:methyltransferase family protein [Mycolicibacterium nivoides]|uniref:methyltransferase family protein n=1 Tax=Mycolicibacterium nivoides TaxID=2487344 RepID=UPI0008D31245|nr:isoprenylcysteine carboxylmethyltransferase family protein [Mycolicibacterium nivoides]SEQ54796.1 Protein-S-isoprenylcysteine O-methyltransferase Ste14 [Mycobacterium sp. 88mf]SFF71805.1 Protein-S-isoprenylcysteine O-methyltransferase Ste14 [Mycobacterium sp. 455mf]
MNTVVRMLISGSIGMAVTGLVIFASAGTFDYWRGWVFLAVLVVSGWVSAIYFLRKNPAVLLRRLPTAEERPQQKAIAIGVLSLWAAMIVVSALDHRFKWSVVATEVSLAGDVLVALGLAAIGLVLMQNNHAAVTVRVEENQHLVSTGLYGLVRHPMYTCNALLLVGIPLALGSFWGLIFLIPGVLLFALRIQDEERVLEVELDGYRDYMQKVRYRLLPGIW